MKHLEKRTKKTAATRHYRATASTSHKPERRNKKRETIVHRIVRIFKILDKKERVFLSLIALGFMICLISLALPGCKEAAKEPTEIAAKDQIEYIFRNGDGCRVDVEAMTNAWAAEAGKTKRYDLTDDERWEVASVVTAEARNEPFAGKVAVAQCILQACEDDGMRPGWVVRVYGYTTGRPEPTQEALDAVQAVFDFGQVATTEPIKYFYAPAITESDWHETQVHVLTINGHKFFKEAK